MLVESAALVLAEMMLLEAPGEYIYDTVEEKRWTLGSGGASGNCEYCEDAAARGWIDMDEVYDTPMGDEDGPPAHPHCDCGIDYRTRRFRVAA
jgi:hypothetical protein